jgi:hypothetical protein
MLLPCRKERSAKTGIWTSDCDWLIKLCKGLPTKREKFTQSGIFSGLVNMVRNVNEPEYQYASKPLPAGCTLLFGTIILPQTEK